MIAVYPMVAAHLWQSTLFSVVIGLLTLLFRKSPARTRYWVWLAASVKFLVPFGVLVSLGGHLSVPGWRPKAPPMVQPAISFVMGDVNETAVRVRKEALPAPQPTNSRLPAILLGVWACGFMAITLRWIRRWTLVRADVRAARPLPMEIGIPVVCSPVQREPGVFGIFRPVLLLPVGMAEELSKAEWEAILAHELCHARCYDNLTAAIYMLVENIFWFHPLVWWMGKRMVLERELACDEEVLRRGSEPKVYAEGILKVCELYLESPTACVAGVSGSTLRRRIEGIMNNRTVQTLTRGKKLLLACTAMTSLTLPVVIGLLGAPSTLAQSRPASAPKWEVASIRSCKDFSPGERGANKNLSPNRMTLSCYVLQSLIVSAYLQFPDGVEDRDPGLVLAPPIHGGPGWINSERYTINAKAEYDTSPGIMQGPMLQALLEDRFKLKAHFEVKGDQPAYALTVAKGGPKLKPFVGNCTWQERIQLTPQPGDCLRQNTFKDGKVVIDEQGITIQEFSYIYLRISPFNGIDGPVFDRTGITGRYEIHLESVLLPPPSLRQNDDSASDGPTLFTALQEQLGLRLDRIKAPRKLLVVDHIERPSEN